MAPLRGYKEGEDVALSSVVVSDTTVSSLRLLTPIPPRHSFSPLCHFLPSQPNQTAGVYWRCFDVNLLAYQHNPPLGSDYYGTSKETFFVRVGHYHNLF